MVSFASTANFDHFWRSSGMLSVFCLYGCLMRTVNFDPFWRSSGMFPFDLYRVTENGKLRPFLEIQRHVFHSCSLPYASAHVDKIPHIVFKKFSNHSEDSGDCQNIFVLCHSHRLLSGIDQYWKFFDHRWILGLLGITRWGPLNV